MRKVWFAALLVASAYVSPAAAVEAVAPSALRTYAGMCEASAAVSAPGVPGRFVVLNDEDNVVRVYDLATGKEDKPLALDLNGPLGLNASEENDKADFEGAAWVGDSLYVIASHSRSGQKGKIRTSRWQLLTFKAAGSTGGLRLDHTAQGGLAEALSSADPRLAEALQLDVPEAADLKPELKGLNIEGLAATPEGGLIIGFRNPRADNRNALVAFIPNPASGAVARVGEIDLGERGIRSLEYDPTRKVYLVMAGTNGAGAPGEGFALFEWSGQASDHAAKPVAGFEALHAKHPTFSPEAMYLSADGRELHLFSDDGDLPRCKEPEPKTPGKAEKDAKPAKDKNGKKNGGADKASQAYRPYFEGVTFSLR